MKLQARFKKTLALTAVATTLFSCMPAVAFASDYTGHWAETTINEWKDKGVIDGYEDGSFKPKQEVTRAELA
ncbi:MAG: S-layer homology domain-containing protein, partial [Niameybacter sp.]